MTEKEFNDLPGGPMAITVGVVIAILVCVLSLFSLPAGVLSVLVIGLLFFAQIKNWIRMPDYMITVFSAAFATLPFAICAFCFFWLIISLLSQIALLFL